MTANEALHVLAKEVASHLGDGWAYVPPQLQKGENLGTWASIHKGGTAGPGLSISTVWVPRDSEASRVVIHARDWPKSKRGEVYAPNVPYGEDRKKYHPEITVSISRGPEAIAREIRSRLLPTYLPLWAEQSARVQKSDDFQDKQDDLLLRMAKVTGAEDQLVDRTGKDRCRFTASPEDGPYVEVKASSETVDLEFSNLPPDLAEKLLRISKIKDRPRDRIQTDEPEPVPEPDFGASVP